MTFTWTRPINDRVISTKPVLLKSVILTPSSATKRGDLTLYDGESASDPQIIKLLGAPGYSTQFNFEVPLETHRGLYFDKGGDVGDVLIQYAWIDE